MVSAPADWKKTVSLPVPASKEVGTVISRTGKDDAVVTATTVNGGGGVGIKARRMVSSPSSLNRPESNLWL